jgi:hypothetical protein
LPEDTIQTRRKRARGDERDNKGTKIQAVEVEMANGTEEDAEDDGTVRCICGYDEYPGPPQLGDEDSKYGVRQGIEEPIITVADVTEELSGFFLQCDICKVWQHGGCVGIMSEEVSPEEYFCEECRKDLHKTFTAPNGYVDAQLSGISPSPIWLPIHPVSPDAKTWRRTSLTRLAASSTPELQQTLLYTK